MPRSLARHALLALLSAVLGGTAAGQVFQSSVAKIPGGAPFNASSSENVDFGDVDLDGDWDVAFADGGDSGNDQNRLWINLGGLQSGSVGFFADETATRLPAVNDTSRDIEFVDLEADGDPDLFVANSSAVNNQPNRFWVNQGGAQGGSAGFFADETLTRYVGLGQNNGTSTFSSVSPALVLVAGGYVDWSCDSGFADLDADGDLDLVQSTYGSAASGKVPMRLFLNDGQGRFVEFNPSGFQLSGSDLLDGSPGLWAEGTQLQGNTNATGVTCDIANLAISLDLADLDGDLDLDLLQGSLDSRPRVFQNRREELGGSFGPLREVTTAVFPTAITGGRKYEQELGDLDGDDDLDLYATNWSGTPCDLVFESLGDGTFALPQVQAGSCVLNNEPEFIDFDADGDLDVLIASDAGQEQLFENTGWGAGGALVLGAALLPPDTTSSLGVDVADLDDDGDFDAFVASDLGAANVFLENLTQTPDASAPRLARLEQAPDRQAGPTPTVVRVQHYDNQPHYLSAFDTVTLEVSVHGTPFFAFPMRWSGGQVFRGEIPGALAGSIVYRVRATDRVGNQTLSPTLSFVSGSSCPNTATVYCTSQTSSAGCAPAMSWSGYPSASAGAGFFLDATGVIGGNFGILFYSKTGAGSVPFGGGTLCVLPPTRRTPVQVAAGSGGCGGSFRLDFNAWVAQGQDVGLVAGQAVWAQYWWRDPASAAGTNLTDAVSFALCD